MSQYFALFLSIIFLCIGCTEKEEFIGAEDKVLTIRWTNNTGIFSNAFLYETEYDYINHIEKPEYSTYGRSVKPKPPYNTNREAFFFEFKPLPYYLRVFSASSKTGYIEHIQGFPNQLKDPLIENSRTVLHIDTRIEKVKGVELEFLEFLNLEDSLNLVPGSIVIYSLEQHWGSEQFPTVTTIETKEVVSHDGKSVIIEPSSSTINSFTTENHRKHTVSLRTLTGQQITRVIDLFKEMNRLRLYTDEFNIPNTMGENELKLKVRWIK